MLAFLGRLFSGEGFMPHGHCYLWKPQLVWLHFWTDMLIGLSYVAISLTLVVLVRRSQGQIPFHSMLLAFGTFIVACGATHFMAVWNIWNPAYWAAAWIKVVTAVASVATAVALPPLVPVALNLLREARVSEGRRLELETAHSELRDLYARLKEFDDLKTRFFANVSHELRTPLALIQGPVERLLERADPEDRLELEVVARNARTLRARVDDLLDVARLEVDRMELHPSDVDLGDLVRVTAAHFDALARQHGIRYRVDAPPGVLVRADSEKLQRTLLNLLSNAFKFTPVGGTVACRMEVLAEDHVRLQVADSGPGIPPHVRESLFERFAQGERPATSLFGGTGLGLAISREFVQAHGGTLTVADAPEGGALLVLDLPGLERVATAAAVLPAPVQGVEPPSPGESRPDACRLLLVEDNPDLREFLVRTLQADYRLEVARDGQEALEKALADPPDLVLTDLMMPRMGGDELLRALRQRAELDPVPVVVLTARADEQLRVQLLREGAQDFVLKPFSVEELQARLGIQATLKTMGDLLRRELQGTRSNLVDMASDLAERKRSLEAALERVEAAREVAERASRIKSDFLRLVSHELRTPLHTMTLYVQLLRRGPAAGEERQAQAMDRLEGALRRLVDLVDSLLEYTRIQNRSASDRAEDVLVAEVVEEVLAELGPRAAAKGLALQSTVEEGLPPLRADRRLLRVVLRNLVENAVKYTDHGHVGVNVCRSGHEQRVLVSDTGPGIAAGDQRRVFEPFEQLEPIKHKHTEGVGLGLAIVREISEVLGGRVDLESSPGQGATFILTLPAGGAS